MGEIIFLTKSYPQPKENALASSQPDNEGANREEPTMPRNTARTQLRTVMQQVEHNDIVRAADNDMKRERFRRVAPGRVAEAIAAMRKIAKLGNVNYVVTPKDKETIISALQRELNEIETALSGNKHILFD